MAAFKWLTNLGRIYGASFMLLIGFGYWIQGFRCFPWLAVNFYLKDVLAVDPTTLQFLQNTVFLPLVAKPVYGIISDAIYIRGAHRIPYLVIGGCLQAICWGIIALLPKGGSSVITVAALLALTNLGSSMADVANDALVAECAKKKKSTGELQSFAWFWTAAGGVLGNLVAAFAVGRVEFKLMFSVFGILVLFHACKSVSVNERSLGLRIPHSVNGAGDRRDELFSDMVVNTEKRVSTKLHPHSINESNDSQEAHVFEKSENWYKQSSVSLERSDFGMLHIGMPDALSEKEVRGLSIGMKKQLSDLIILVKQPDILYPLAWFVASYAMIPTLSGTMFFYQTQHLKVDPSIVGMAKVMGQVGLMGASASYSRYLKNVPLRKLLAIVQILTCMCILFDILLVKRVNVWMGIPDYMMVMGLSAYVEGIHQFKVLPLMVLLGQLCPTGSEGALLAALMSMQCLSSIISGYMGVALASMLHISSHDFSELSTAILVQAFIALLPLLWISFIPAGPRATSLPQSQQGKSI
ncbi:hypothetical protein GOP47_0026396 [Adiantum capillus-veneris]|nr:hypothetical protein GOP47_0026396 [Adiantum capillus-veneris]